MATTYKLMSASVRVREEPEDYTRPDGTQGHAEPGVTIKTADGNMIKLGFVDAAMLANLMVDLQDLFIELVDNEMDELKELSKSIPKSE